MSKCDCDGWRIGQPQVDSAWMNSTNHHGPQYKGPLYRYCPWCGKGLKEIKPIESMAVKLGEKECQTKK